MITLQAAAPRSALERLTIGIALVLAIGCTPEEPGLRERPNIVVLFADDLGYGDLSSYGHPSIRTPNLDRLAAAGQRWTDFYVAAPVCSPSRAALLTGRLPLRSGIYGRRLGVYFEDDPGGLPSSELTLAEALRELGYRTAMIGKWHLGDRPEAWPTRHGFDRWLGIPFSNDMRWEIGYTFAEILAAHADGRLDDLAADRERKWQAYLEPRSEYWSIPLLESESTATGFSEQTRERPAAQETLTARFTDEALGYLERRAAESPDQPFFLYLAYSMPHIPLFRSDAFEGKSRGGRYGDVIEELDWSVGRIAGALDELGMADDTLLIFTSDNGPWLHVGGRLNPDGGFAGPLSHGKGTTFEGGMRVPAIVSWPGTVEPGVVSELGSTLDLFATAISLAGGALPAGRVFDSFDLGPVLRGEGPSPRTTLPYYRQGELQAFRHGRYKLRLISEGAYGAPPARQVHEPPLLFDLGEDPAERRDLSTSSPDLLAATIEAVEAHRSALVPAPPELDRRLQLSLDG